MSKQRKHYAERDIIEMDLAGNYYGRHVSAMTGERLHSKSDIAAELGFRDQRIDALHAEAEALRAEIEELDSLRNRQSDLLSQTAIALRGPEPALTRYSHADIPSRVKTVVAELEAAQGLLAQLRGMINCTVENETDKMPVWISTKHPVIEQIDAFLTATPAPEVRCPTCDGTGDVHRADGEWLGECHCAKAEQGERQEPVAWQVRNGLVTHGFYKNEADARVE